MARYDYDLFVIGGGSGGVRAARIAAGYGAQGGHRRGIPGRRHLRHPRLRAEEAAGLCRAFPRGLRGRRRLRLERRRSAKFDWAALIANKDQEIDRLNGIYKKLLSNSKVALIESRAVLVDPHTLEIGGKRITAEYILIADRRPARRCRRSRAPSSASPRTRRSICRNCRGASSSPAAATSPCEFAGIFGGLGAKVTQLYRGEQILRGFDDDIRNTLAAEMGKKGIDIRLNTIIKRTDKIANGYRLTLSDGTVLETDLRHVRHRPHSQHGEHGTGRQPASPSAATAR